MAYSFLEIARTPGVIAAQQANGSAELYASPDIPREFTSFSEKEVDFISHRDSFYLASVSETGWPYVQHRGGPAGFLRFIDTRTLGFADYRGNRQYISLGNTSANNRVSLILMDYPNRRRLKIYARMETRDLAGDPELAGKVLAPEYKAKPELIVLLHLEAFDWNCPQHITQRFTVEEIRELNAPLYEHVAKLEAEIARLKTK